LIWIGRKSSRVFFTVETPTSQQLRSIDLDGTSLISHADLPLNFRVESVNADETIAVAVTEDLSTAGMFNGLRKGQLLYARAKANIPMSLHRISLTNGQVRRLYSSTEWLSHPQFSPTDPDLLMYSIEGPWHETDRMWLLHMRTEDRTLIHKRTEPMEIVGHEFWGCGDNRIYFDWQKPKGQIFRLGFYDVKSKVTSFAQLERRDWAVHFNCGAHDQLIGDGADARQVSKSADSRYIYSYIKFGQPGMNARLEATKLVDMGAHDYTLEPNARLSPDGKWVLFRSNMFGYPDVFAVEMTPSRDPHVPKLSTSQFAKEHAREYNEIMLKN
jgi:oligogalacturonide lyase